MKRFVPQKSQPERLRCRRCATNDHSWFNCRFNMKNRNKNSANLASSSATAQSEDREEVSEEGFLAKAYSSRSYQSKLSNEMKNRLGEQSTTAEKSPYDGVFPVKKDVSNEDCDKNVVFPFDEESLEIMNEDELMISGLLTSCVYQQLRTTNSFDSFQILKHEKSDVAHHDVQAHANFKLSDCDVEFEENLKIKQKSNEQDWIIDSGASIHITTNKNVLRNFQVVKNRKVVTSDGTQVPIVGLGDLNIVLRNKFDGKQMTVALKKVAYVPSFTVNLISIRALTEDDVEVRFTSTKCFIANDTGVYTLATVSDSLYKLKIHFGVSESALSTESLKCVHDWHKAMCHKNLKHIKSVANIMSLSMRKCNCSDVCESCLKGKFHALPFPQKSEKPSKARDIIASDICGPFNVESMGKSRYFITFVDVATDYTEVKTLRNRHECKEKVIEFMNKMKTQFGDSPRVFRADRAGEYLDESLQKFLRDKGIVFQCSVAYCHEQNGIAERKNRTLLDAVRTILTERNLPKYLWAEALYHATATFNDIPKLHLQNSPREIFFNKSFSKEFHEFGSRVFCILPNVNRSKLSPRAQEGIFLGFDENSKGYRILIEGKVRVHRHVKFLPTKSVADESVENSSEQNLVPQENTQVLRRSERIRNQ
jgi:transposase InsO family protein